MLIFSLGCLSGVVVLLCYEEVDQRIFFIYEEGAHCDHWVDGGDLTGVCAAVFYQAARQGAVCAGSEGVHMDGGAISEG